MKKKTNQKQTNPCPEQKDKMTMNLAVALGDTIRHERATKGMTLRELSAKSHISLGYLREVERGTKEMSSAVLDCVAKGLDVPTYVLVSNASLAMMLKSEIEIIEPTLMEKTLTR